VKLRVLAPVLAAVAVTVAGCGSNDDNASSTSSADAHAAYIARADAFCRTANARAVALNQQFVQIDHTSRNATEALTRMASLFASVIPEQARLVDEFKRITPPPADLPAITRLWRLLDVRASYLPRLRDLARRGDVEEFKRVTVAQNALSRSIQKAEASFGFKVCGRGGS
jgi:hypothetical protein